MSPELLDAVRFHLDETVKLEDLAKSCWRRQTDVVKQIFIVARMFADLKTRAVFIDGHLNESVKARAAEHGDVKAFFNRRCHDAGLKTRRLIVFDTVTTNKMGNKGNSKARLHFHGLFELPEGVPWSEFEKKLRKVFGNAETGDRRMGRRQFHRSGADWKKFCSHNGVQAHGPIGKLLYALKHAGSSYRALELNEDGKRSRKAPTARRIDNKKSRRLGQGIPSNFNRDVVLCDNASKRAGQQAFETWLAAERQKATLPVRVEVVVPPPQSGIAA